MSNPSKPAPPAPRVAALGLDGRSIRLVVLGVALGTVLLFLPAYWYDFIYLDDYDYIVANPQVQEGLTWVGVKWAFTAGHASNWHPLTWLSHMLDCSLFGVNPGPHHLVNVLLHAFNSGLVVLLWYRLTGQRGTAFLIGALFAWHPLRLESVVWIAERKDVLSACFGLSALWSYVIYAQGRMNKSEKSPAELATCDSSCRYYWLALFLFALGLLAKPMLVTIPCVLLLLDFWPLGRWGKPGRLVWEKAPFFLLSVLSCVVTVIVQRREAVVSLESFPLTLRLENALISYVRYLGKIIYPVDLAVFYPMPLQYPLWQVLGAGLGLAGISFWVWRERQRRPWCLMGWCWYVGMLVPVIGLVQVGWQAGADRYTYWPAIGLVAALVFTVSQQVEKMPARKFTFVALGGLLVLAFAGLTAWQLPSWRNAETLGTRALEVTKQNTVGRQLRGKYYYDQGRREEALREFQQAVQLGGSYVPGAASGGNADFSPDNQPEKIGAERESSLPLLPGSAPAHNDLGNLLSDLGRKEEALQHYRAASRLSSYSVEPYNNVAITLAELERFPEALVAHARAIELAPDVARSYYLTGKTYWRMGQGAKAIRYFRQALAIAPQDYQSLTMLARILASTPDASLRNGTEAVALAQQAAELTGQQQPMVLDVLAMAYAEQGNFAAAQQAIAQAITLATTAQATNLVVELQAHAAAFAGQQPWRHTNATPVQAHP
jgi:tetratricopeptide (TPR) repeat protein